MSGGNRELVDRLLDAARRDVAPGEAERQAKIYDRVIGGAAGGGQGPSAPRPLRSWAGFTAVGLGALALVGAGVFGLVGTPSKKSEPATSSAASDTATLPSKPTDVLPASTADAPPTATTPIGTSVWELPSIATPPPPEKPAVTSTATDELALELAALENARRKLRDRDPAGALKLLDDFDHRFPRPRAGEEATVLRVEVLFGLGREDEARRIGRTFITRRPDSIYRARVAQLLGDASP